jgi:hypothetical protein
MFKAAIFSRTLLVAALMTFILFTFVYGICISMSHLDARMRNS